MDSYELKTGRINRDLTEEEKSHLPPGVDVHEGVEIRYYFGIDLECPPGYKVVTLKGRPGLPVWVPGGAVTLY